MCLLVVFKGFFNELEYLVLRGEIRSEIFLIKFWVIDDDFMLIVVWFEFIIYR